MGSPSFGWISFQSMMTLDRACATEEFLTFVSGLCRPWGQSWAVYFPTRGSRTSAGSTILNRLPLPPRFLAQCDPRSLRRPTAPSRGQAPFLPILSSALAQHGRSARKFARDAPKECPTLYPPTSITGSPEDVSLTTTRIVPPGSVYLIALSSTLIRPNLRIAGSHLAETSTVASMVKLCSFPRREF